MKSIRNIWHFIFFFNSKKAASSAFIPKIIQAIGLIHYFTRINNDAKGFNHTKEASHTVKKTGTYENAVMRW